MISHFDAAMAMRHRQIEIERAVRSHQLRAAQDSISKQSRVSNAGSAISSLVGKMRGTTAPQTAVQGS